MQTYASFVGNSILKILKTGSNQVSLPMLQILQFQEMPLAVLLVLAKVGHTEHAQMIVKHLYVDTATDTSMCLT